MKKLLFLGTAFFTFQLASAQDSAQVQPLSQNSNGDNEVYTSVEVNAEFPGGINGFSEYIGGNFRNTFKNGGKILVSFIVEKDGSLSEINVIRDFGEGSGDEAVRVLKASPKWSPGILNGKLARQRFVLPIVLGPGK